MPVITYNLGIPDAPNNPSDDQPLMKTNTNAINALIQLDHFTFADANAGWHKQVTLTNESAPGIPAGTNGVLFANSVAGVSWPFWQNATGSFQMFGVSSNVANGYATLNSGIKIQWGSVNSPGSSGSVSFPITFGTGVFSIQLTPRNDGSHSAFTYWLDGAPSGSGFSYRGSTSGSNTLYWFAIGT